MVVMISRMRESVRKHRLLRTLFRDPVISVVQLLHLLECDESIGDIIYGYRVFHLTTILYLL